MKNYYWLDTAYYYGDFNIPKLALVKGEIDEGGEKNRASEEVIIWTTYEDIGVELGEDADPDETDKAIDRWIESELGFLPDYEIN